jgi:pyruvate formate lyase activating enzyme
VLFTSGCNFDCPYCHNPDLVNGRTTQPLAVKEGSIYDFLEMRKDFLDGVVISGGEPTLHGDLKKTCRRIKRMGFPIKLDTNGSRPETINSLLDEECIDYIAMDIKTDPLAYTPFISKDCVPENILASIATIMQSGLPYEFRTTCIKPLIDADTIQRITDIIQGAKLYALQQFHDDRVLDPAFFLENDSRYSLQELQHFQSLASPKVEACIIR